MTGKTYALHFGLLGEDASSETLAPVYCGTDLSDLLTEGDGCNREGRVFAFGTLDAGSWQEWGEPTVESVSDFHLVVTRATPWDATRISDARARVVEALTLGRVSEVMVTSDGDDWSEEQRIYTGTIERVEGPYLRDFEVRAVIDAARALYRHWPSVDRRTALMDALGDALRVSPI